MSNDWKVRGIRMASPNRLVLDVEPMYGNLKKYQGEMEFNLDSEQMKVLRQVLAEEGEKERRLEIAKAELDEMIRAKRKELRASLGLEGESNLPFWLWDGPH